MAAPTSHFLPKRVSLFLNISFLFLLFFFIETYGFLGQSNNEKIPIITTHNDSCAGLHDYTDYRFKCLYVRSEIGCRPKGYLNYLQIFYCTCGRFPFLGHLVLLTWLFILFYLLGDTAANYFCTSLESLSKILRLSPAIAGVTLLSLGNGASDVFASFVSFTRSGNGDVGLNCVLGGAFFVSSAVVGVISILISSHQISIDEPSFIRDVIFFLFSLSSLMLIIFIGEITLWGALSFLSIYFLYVCAVSASYFFNKNKGRKVNFIPVSSVSSSHDNFGEVGIPLLGYATDEKPVTQNTHTQENLEENPKFFNFDSQSFYYFELCNSQREKHMGSKSSLVSYMIAGLVGMVFGNLAFVTTKKSSPPKRCQLPWFIGGFLMSVTWTYFTAEELVSLLVSFGNILGISPSVLGLTVLAWGNSLGDLISNSAMAINGGADGAQTAISGCYAGPMFNTLVGLGISLVCSSWSEYPSSFEIPIDPSLYETLGFLMAGLLWALVVLPRKNMKLERLLGGGLLAIYFCFLSLRLARALGLLKFH
ncbi:hypothetical protein DITRI_Ditri20bG0062400 [Diplodiscus trichospermus]